ncbi:hypothetical protein GJAV_G00159420 [Gymnothorax javanicus]|nr:hypothetical protein GJAV_G00159420 [Gymnothorax javanicus]
MDSSQRAFWPTGEGSSNAPVPQLAQFARLDSADSLDAEDLDLYNSLPFQPQCPLPPPIPPRPQPRTCPISPLESVPNFVPGETAAGVPADQIADYCNQRELAGLIVVPPPVPPRRRAASVKPSDRQITDEFTDSKNKLSRSNTAHIHNQWMVKLMDTPQGSNERLTAFCSSISRMRSKYPHTDSITNSGIIWGRVYPQHLSLSQTAQLTISVSTPWLPHAVPLPTNVNRAVLNLIEEIMRLVGVSTGPSREYLLKLCDTEEFLRNDEIFGAYESIQAYLKFKMEVPVRLMHQSSLDSLLRRDVGDDTQPFNLNHLLESSYTFSKSRVKLEDKLNSYSKEVNQLMRSQCGSNINKIVEVVREICSSLCGFSIKEVEDAIGQLNRIRPTILDPSELSDCETAMVILHQAIRKLLHVFFENFNSDGKIQNIPLSPPIADASQNIDILQVDLVALYKLQISWRNSFDCFCISCSLTYGGNKLCDIGISENISTARALDNKIQCSRTIVFPMQIRQLPYESMLTFRLLGSKQGKNPELLRWAVLPLYNNRTLVSGTVLLGMSSLVELSDPPSPALSNSHRQPTGVILQLEFPSTHRWKYERPKAVNSTLLFSPPCEELRKKLTGVSEKHCLSFLSETDKVLLWDKRHYCNEENTQLHLLLGSVPQWRPEDLSEIYTILEGWSLRRPEEALFLLSDSFPDQNVRRAAVQSLEQLSDTEIEDYLPQLVQALKMEWELDGPLVLFLLERSLRCIRMAQQLYWLLKDSLEDVPYRSWYSKLQAALKHCCGYKLQKELELEETLVSLLTHVADRIRLADKSKRKEVLQREKQVIKEFFKGGVSCRLALDPAVLVKGVNVDACKYFSSNAAPLAVPFIIADCMGRNVSIICKTGDNLRQDMLVLQLVRLMDRRPGAGGSGAEAVTLGKIHQKWGIRGTLREDTLEKWFRSWNKTEEAYEEAVMNFLHSCAGWCVATFILGICDRHNDNIMLKQSGHMFHIDFGKIMGNAQKIANIKRDRSPFIYTSEMQHFVTGGGQMPQRFHKFVELCCQAYNGIRRRTGLVLSLLQLMLGAGMPEMKDSQHLLFVYNNLKPQHSDLEATSFFTSKIRESIGSSLLAKLNFLFHTMAQPSAKRAETLKQARTAPRDTNIQEAVIQKYTTRGKDLVFEMKVTIEDGFLISERTYSQFEMIHQELQKHFMESSLPKFPGWYKISFTPERKKSLLNKYLKELFEGPCRGNEFVCSLFLDGPRTATSKKESSPKIQLSMSYHDRKLSVLVKHIENITLPSGACPDAYVVTKLYPDPYNHSKKKTKVIRNSEHPSFNDLIEYPDVLSLSGRVLELRVKSKKMPIAATNIPLDSVWMGADQWFPLEKTIV